MFILPDKLQRVFLNSRVLQRPSLSLLEASALAKCCTKYDNELFTNNGFVSS